MKIRCLRCILALTATTIIATSMLAQDAGPKLIMAPIKDSPTIPAGLQAYCLYNPNTMQRTDHCPVFKYGTWTTWAYSPVDSKEEFLQLVTFDERGNVIKSVRANGARFPVMASPDPATKTVIYNAQHYHQIMVPWAELGPGPNPPPTIVYRWVTDRRPPQVSFVTAPNSKTVVCRGQGPEGQLVGYWDGSHCLSTFAGNDVTTTEPYSFLAQFFFGPMWFTGKKQKFPAEIGLVPFNRFSAGVYNGTDMVVCSQGGLIGYVKKDRCAIAGPARGSMESATVLIGSLYSGKAP